MRALLVNLHSSDIMPGDEDEYLGLGYLAAVARQAGHEVNIVDGLALRKAVPALLHHIAQSGLLAGCGLVGVTVPYQQSIPDAASLVRGLRRRGFVGHVVLGGHPPTFLFRELVRDYDGFDSLAVGEGEDTLVELMDALDRGQDWHPIQGLIAAESEQPLLRPHDCQPAELNPVCRPLILDLDALPFPSRDTLPHYLTHQARMGRPRAASVLRSRGCYGNCSFCDIRAFYAMSPGPAWRTRSAGDVAEEMELLVSDYRVEIIRFWDDNFMGPGQRGYEAAEAMAHEIVRRRLPVRLSLQCRVTDVEPELFRLLRDAGLYRVFLGVESMSQRQLDYFEKRSTTEQNRFALKVVEDLGLEVAVGYIMFDPDTTLEEFESNTRALSELLGGWAGIRKKVINPWNRLEVLAGTPAEGSLRAAGRLEGNYLDYTYSFSDSRVALLYKVGLWLQRAGLPVIRAIKRRSR